MEEKAEALFTADVLKQLSSSNWKERLEGTQKMTDVSKLRIKNYSTIQLWYNYELHCYQDPVY